jgi:hypothetical protein
MALSVPEKLKGKVFIRESPIAPAAAAINEGHDPPNRRYRPSSPAAQSPTRGYGISMFRMPVMLIAFPIALPEIDQTIIGDGEPSNFETRPRSGEFLTKTPLRMLLRGPLTDACV